MRENFEYGNRRSINKPSNNICNCIKRTDGIRRLKIAEFSKKEASRIRELLINSEKASTFSISE